jgi:hypothetical protein
MLCTRSCNTSTHTALCHVSWCASISTVAQTFSCSGFGVFCSHSALQTTCALLPSHNICKHTDILLLLPLQVGRALKAVDTRLLKEWTDWGNSIASTNTSTANSSSIISNTMSGSTAMVSATAAAATAAAASSSGVKYSATQCQAVWDFLSPMACDTHACKCYFSAYCTF